MNLIECFLSLSVNHRSDITADENVLIKEIDYLATASLCCDVSLDAGTFDIYSFSATAQGLHNEVDRKSAIEIQKLFCVCSSTG